ncbi:MAG: KPN_02809 family neutral zinc metallopeptidase [Solirubrobacteraceae bacterium]
MKWRPGQRSGSIEDRRSSGGGGLGGTGLPMGKMGGGVGGLVVVLLVVLLGGGNVLGGGGGGGTGVNNPFDVINAQPPAQGDSRDVPGAPDPDAQLVAFMSFVLDDIQESWTKSFSASGKTYDPTTLVLFRSGIQSGCGAASSATGPFYCPADRKVYLDLGFFRELSSRFKAPGDFAQAYVLAHEVGHHLQTLLGVSEQVNRESAEHPDRRNDLSVRQELQADCLAGVWAHSTYERGILEGGDLEEGLAAAAAVGDDRIQRETQGRVSPETFTHGTSEQRSRWFRTGFDSGDADRCDSFSGDV